MFNIRFLVAFGALSALVQAAPEPQKQPPASTPQRSRAPQEKPVDGHLVRVQTVTTPSEMTNFFRKPTCDSEGNLYFRTEVTGIPAIHKLNAKGERLTVFEPTSNPDLKVSLAYDFAFEPGGGDLYELVFPRVVDRYVYVYKSDGTFKSAVKLQPGFVFMPKRLAVFSSGQFLISGEHYDKDVYAALLPFTGIFGSDGKLLKELELGDERDLHDMAAAGDKRVTLPQNPHANLAIDYGHLEMGADGNAYLMRWTNPAILYAISAGGEVVRHFSVDPGESGYRPSAMHLYKNRIAVLFVEVQSQDAIMKVVDLEGHEIATYDRPKYDAKRKDEWINNVFACYTENPTRFVFFGAEDDTNKVQFWIAEPR